ncbi:hypothetical protein DENIS_3070 [Desulfonema ishimotonii]|uniref:histidine kinase n=1 Tax=Desulfonema ishimotonii TaxID=45657 RepID=A0A401FYS5_9BACT|nr:ATP-binding protein [Desulfonema ishimotonii]GBC62107.1 hypothetical protein DENIS_3070 [Desulfonema ishimotonii]
MNTPFRKNDILFVAVLCILCVISEYHETFSLLEDQTVFFRHAMRSALGDRKEMAFPYDRIVLVTFDETFFKKYGKSPLKRSDLARIIDNLNRLGAKVICLDFLMDLPDAYGEDVQLVRSLQKSRAVLASQALFDHENRFQKINYPAPVLRETAPSGYVNLTSPSSLVTFLGRLRVYPEITHLKDGWPIAVRIASEYLGVTPVLKDRALILGNISVSLGRYYDMYIDFSMIPDGYRFIHELAGITAHEFLDISSKRERELRELKAWVDGKIVILGETSAIASDWFDTPVGMVYGPEIIADTVNTLLKGAPLKPATPGAECFASLFFLTLILLLSSLNHGPYRQCLYAVMVLVAQTFVFTLLYVRHGIVFSMSYNMLACFLACLGLSFSAYVSERKRTIREHNEKEQVEREREAAEASNRAKSVFLANMSHEIRTPLNAILGFTEILESQLRDEQHREYLSAISASGKSLLTLINDILDLSKIEAGKLKLEYAAVNPRAVVEEVGVIFSQAVRSKNLALKIEISPEVPEALVLDELRIRQVLFNLLGNAVKFTEKGYIRLALHARKTDPQARSSCLIFSVADTGIGIPADQLDAIFGAFEQKKGQSNARYGGTGLGLTISRHLVKMMNGDIRVESEVAAGTTFDVVLHDVETASVSDVCELSRSPSVCNVSFEPATILIAEDVRINRDLLKGFLKDYDFDLMEAENGKEAVAFTRTYHPDLILMDMRMPEMDGYNATRIIKAEKTLKSIPIIAITASATKGETHKIRGLCDACLPKPVGKTELIETLSHFLRYSIAISENTVSDPLSGPAKPLSVGCAREKLLTLIRMLENQFRQQWEEISKVMFIDHIEEFGERMEQVGAEYDYAPLSTWGRHLKAQAHMFDMDALPRTLNRFPALIRELRATLSV